MMQSTTYKIAFKQNYEDPLCVETDFSSSAPVYIITDSLFQSLWGHTTGGGATYFIGYRYNISLNEIYEM